VDGKERTRRNKKARRRKESKNKPIEKAKSKERNKTKIKKAGRREKKGWKIGYSIRTQLWRQRRDWWKSGPVLERPWKAKA
jgi:hypothetical protein